jgi:MFS family permease
VIGPYRSLFALPGAARAEFSALLGRLPLTMIGLAVLLLVRAETGSFATAGGATAAFAVGVAVSAPLLGRWVDRAGPAPVIRLMAVLQPAFLVLLVPVVTAGLPALVIFATAAAVGLTLPPLSAVMRSLWLRLTPDEGLRHTANAFESVAIETLFALGPMLVGALVALASPAVAVLVAAGCVAAGAGSFVAAPVVRGWEVAPRPPAGSAGPLRVPAVRVALLVTLSIGTAFGLVEVGIAAAATEQGTPALAGVLLGVWSVGSVLGGLWYGSRTPRAPLRRQLATGAAVLAAALVPLPFVGPLPLLGGLLFLSGCAVAPTLAALFGLLGQIAPPLALTETFTWATTVIFAGGAVGNAVGGAVVEARDSGAALALTAALAALAAGIAFLLPGGVRAERAA